MCAERTAVWKIVNVDKSNTKQQKQQNPKPKFSEKRKSEQFRSTEMNVCRLRFLSPNVIPI